MEWKKLFKTGNKQTTDKDVEGYSYKQVTRELPHHESCLESW
jgi:hypothetical protein